MKKSLIAVAVLGAFASAAQADDALTVYGVVDAAIRSNNNASYNAATNTSQGFVGFSQGLFNGSRFGLKGSEDLGNGMKAIYTLEAGVILGTGVSDQQGQLMGRQSWAGISDDTYGSLTAGRQYGNLSGAIGTGDVFGELHGNEVYVSGTNEGDVASENGFAYGLTGYRWDNSLLYANKVGPVKFSVMHAFAGQNASSTTSGQASTMNSVAVGYVSDSFNATVGYQKETESGPNALAATNSSVNPTHTDIGVGANYMYGDKTEFGGRNGVYAYYLSSKYDSGFYRVGATNSQFNFTQVAATALYSPRQDKVVSISTNYYATPRLNLIAAYFHDTASNVLDPVAQAAAVTASGGTSGSRNGFIVTGDYYFTKNTDTYLMAAHTSFKGALIGNSFGGNATTGASAGVGPTSVTTMMVGFRHRF
jgi:predicted porin